jgi:hypothetical protein
MTATTPALVAGGEQEGGFDLGLGNRALDVRLCHYLDGLRRSDFRLHRSEESFGLAFLNEALNCCQGQECCRVHGGSCLRPGRSTSWSDIL